MLKTLKATIPHTDIKAQINYTAQEKWKLWQIWSNNQLTYAITLTENPDRLYKASIQPFAYKSTYTKCNTDTIVIHHRCQQPSRGYTSITDASSFLKRDYRTNNPYSFDAKSSPHNPKQQCDVT